MKNKIKIPFFQRVKSLQIHPVKIENIRSPFGEPFSCENHWVKTLEEYDSGISDFRKTSLYRFHKNFKPKNIFDVYDKFKKFDKNLELKNIIKRYSLGEYPWGKWTSRKHLNEWKLSSHCGPTDDNLILNEWIRFIDLYKKIKKEGFRYFKYGYPLGIFFVDQFEKKYFIVLAGNHRTAIASFLKIKKMYVRKLPRDYINSQVVKYNQIKNDLLSKQLFNLIISEDFFKWSF